jgi:hypothetical protein
MAFSPNDDDPPAVVARKRKRHTESPAWWKDGAPRFLRIYRVTEEKQEPFFALCGTRRDCANEHPCAYLSEGPYTDSPRLEPIRCSGRANAWDWDVSRRWGYRAGFSPPKVMLSGRKYPGATERWERVEFSTLSPAMKVETVAWYAREFGFYEESEERGYRETPLKIPPTVRKACKRAGNV